MIQYRSATKEDMQEVAAVHMLTQPEYFTTTLGKDLLTKFYTEFLLEHGLFVLAVDDETDKIVGFCMGYYLGSKAEKNWEKKYRKQIIKRLFINCLKLNRLALSRVFRRIKGLFKKLFKKKNTGSGETYFSHLLSLGVLKEYRGKHIASTLIDEFEKMCLADPPAQLADVEKVCTIGAYKWNEAGCKLYESRGYKVFAETKDKLKFSKII